MDSESRSNQTYSRYPRQDGNWNVISDDSRNSRSFASGSGNPTGPLTELHSSEARLTPKTRNDDSANINAFGYTTYTGGGGAGRNQGFASVMPTSVPQPAWRGFSSRLSNLRDRVSGAVNAAASSSSASASTSGYGSRGVGRNTSGGINHSEDSLLRPDGYSYSNPYANSSLQGHRYGNGNGNGLGHGGEQGYDYRSSPSINNPNTGMTTGPTMDPESVVRQSWREWAGEKLRNRRGTGGSQGIGSNFGGSGNGNNLNIEKVSVFPGWAVRKYHGPELVRLEREGDVTPFDLELFVSGFAASYTPPEAASRSQRAFMKVARAFASLPKLDDIPPLRLDDTQVQNDKTSSFTGNHDKASRGDRGDNTLDEMEIAALEAQFARMNENADSSLNTSASWTGRSIPSVSSSSSSVKSAPSDFLSTSRSTSPGFRNIPSGASTPRQGQISLESTGSPKTFISSSDTNSNFSLNSSSHTSGNANAGADDVRLMHRNLDERLHPFWSRSIPNRLLRLMIFCRNPQDTVNLFNRRSSTTQRRNALDIDQQRYSEDSIDESYKPLFVHEVFTSPQGSFQATIKISWETMCTHPGAVHIAFGSPSEEPELYVQAELLDLPPSPSLNTSSSNYLSFANTSSTSRSRSIPTVVPLTITHSHVRLISDIDDTIKLSNILGGARAVFRNVFTRRLEELVIQGMGDWYTYLWSKGVRFHYVSNSPFELLPSINEFIKISNLPRGSIKLRSYAGKSLFNNLLSAPGTRKREGIIDLLNAFDSSRFILVGDTGEQDLELYAQIAQERPHQIAALYLRDARGPEALPLEDPTGEQALNVKQFYEEAGLLQPSSPTSTGPESPISLPVPSNRPFFPRQRSSTTPMTQTQIQDQSRKQVSDGYYFEPEERKVDGDYVVNGRYTSVPQLMIPKVPQSRMDSLSSASSSSSSSSANSTTQRLLDTHAPLSDSPPTSNLPPNSSLPSFSGQTRPPASPMPTNRSRANSSLPLPGTLRAGEVQNLSPAERNRYDLQMRVSKARLIVPSHISLRVFREADECVEESAELLRMLEPRMRDRT